MTRTTLGTAIAALAVIVTLGHLDAAAPPSNAPATAVLSNASGMTILSDGLAEYHEGTDCVRSWFNTSKGNYYFRTASDTYCDYQVDGSPLGATQRSINLVLGTGGCVPVVDDGYGHSLDPCGLNVIPDARLIADSLFKSGAQSTPVTIHFDLYPNFVNPTAFMLTFIDPVPVTINADGSRILGGTTSLLAELKVRQSKGRRSTFVTVGQYYMAFEMTVTPD